MYRSTVGNVLLELGNWWYAEDVPNQTNASFIEGSKSFKDVECGYNFSKEKKELKTFNGLSIDEGQNESYFWFFIFAFVSGLVALLTPCVFPMIPMTVSFFLKESENKSKGKFTALIFGLSIIVIYMLIGSVINLIAGPDAANYIATHWLPNLLFFSVFFVLQLAFLACLNSLYLVIGGIFLIEKQRKVVWRVLFLWLLHYQLYHFHVQVQL